MKKLGSAYDGVLATDAKYVMYFHYDVILRWHLAFETPVGRKMRDLPKLVNVGATKSILVSNAQKGRFPIPYQKTFYRIFIKNCIKLKNLKIDVF